MANYQMIQSSECPTRTKKARIEHIDDNQVCLVKQLSMSYECSEQKKRIYGDFEVTTNEGEILSSGDSGFQEFVSNSCDDLPPLNKSINNNNNNNKSELDINDLIADNTHKLSANDEKQSLLSPQNNELDIDDSASDVSDLSCVSCLSDMSDHGWKPYGPVQWVQRQMFNGTDPRDILGEMIPDNTVIPHNLDNLTLWRIIVNMLSEPPPRSKLSSVNTMEDVVHLINKCNKIVVLTGAGVSVSCGIPDFRSRDGIYARLSKDFPDLPDSQAMFDIHYFRKDPRPFFKFAKEIYPGLFEPSISHKFIRFMEKKSKLLRNYTQNIDTLEQAAGIQRVITCHGSFATATCTRCKHKVDASFIKEDIMEQKIPLCPQCPPDCQEMAVMKPDIVFFGEGLSDEFHGAMSNDKDECDLLIVMGSSLKVRPVALIPSSIPETVPQILINREPLNHLNFDVELLGDCDVIVRQLCSRLGADWVQFCSDVNHVAITDVPKLESKRTDDNCLEVNNNTCQMNSSLPFAFSTSVNELRVLDAGLHHNNCHSSEKNVIEADSTECDEPHPSDAFTIASSLPEDKYLFFEPSRYIFRGAEVYNNELKPRTRDESDDDSNSALSAESTSSQSPLSSSSSTSSSALSSSSSSSSSSSLSTSKSREFLLASYKAQSEDNQNIDSLSNSSISEDNVSKT